jgi:hypothetical protein
MHQRDIEGRNGLPLGDASWHGSLIKAKVEGGELVRGPLSV